MRRTSVSKSATARVIWLVTGGAFLVLAGCALKPPQVPSTPFTVTIPVADDTTTIAKVVRDRPEYLAVDSLGTMALDFTTEEFGRKGYAEVGEDRLSVKPQGNEFFTDIGDIHLPEQSIPTVEIGVNQLLGGNVPPGTGVPIPATDIDTQAEIRIENVTSVKIEEGRLTISLSNGLPMALENVQLSLLDKGQPVGAPKGVARIDRGVTWPATFELSGEDISGTLAIRVKGRTEEVKSADVGKEAGLGISGGISALTVTSISGRIPPQYFEDSQVLEFPDSRIQIKQADIQTGGLTIRVTNQIPLITEVTFTLAELRKPDGSPHVFRIDSLLSGGTREVVFDLRENKFLPDNPLQLGLSYTSRTYEGDATLASGASIRVEAIPERLSFSLVKGVLDSLELNPGQPVTKRIDFPQGLNNLSLGATYLDVFVRSAVGFRSTVRLDLYGKNEFGQEDRFTIDAVFDRGSPLNPRSLVVTPSSEELTAFLNLLPEYIELTPTVLLGDGVGEETVQPADWVQVDSVRFRAPARLRLRADTRIEPDPQLRTLKDERARQRIEQNLIQGSVKTMIENHLPIGVRVSLRVAEQPEDVYTDRALLQIPRDGAFVVPAGTVDATGHVTAGATSEREVTITKEDALIFLRPGGVYTGALVQLDATDGEVVVEGRDYVHIEASARIDIELNEDLVR